MSVSLPTVEDHARLEQKVEMLEVLVKRLTEALRSRQVVTIADICEMEAVSKSQVMGKERYLLPNFGESEYPDGVKRWNWDTYATWRKIPATQRKAMYQQFLERLRVKEVV